MDIKQNFNSDLAKKIFGNKSNAEEFLSELQKTKKFELPFKIISRGKNKGAKLLNLKTNEIWAKIVEHWDYDSGKSIIRELFQNTDKFKSGNDSYTTMNELIDEWNRLKLNSISWPFSQGDFDGFVQRLNSEKISGTEKDNKVKLAAVKYRRIKEINTVRNDFIETLIFTKNDNIIPTLNHRRGVDFFIDGVSFDQKVAKSPTQEFKKDYGANWKDIAIQNPQLVAEYLYKYQDEGRFGADSRLLVVYLDEDVSIESIKNQIDMVNLETPLEINFEYNHKSSGKKTYKVKCFVILIHN